MGEGCARCPRHINGNFPTIFQSGKGSGDCQAVGRIRQGDLAVGFDRVNAKRRRACIKVEPRSNQPRAVALRVRNFRRNRDQPILREVFDVQDGEPGSIVLHSCIERSADTVDRDSDHLAVFDTGSCAGNRDPVIGVLRIDIAVALDRVKGDGGRDRVDVKIVRGTNAARVARRVGKARAQHEGIAVDFLPSSGGQRGGPLRGRDLDKVRQRAIGHREGAGVDGSGGRLGEVEGHRGRVAQDIQRLIGNADIHGRRDGVFGEVKCILGRRVACGVRNVGRDGDVDAVQRDFACRNSQGPASALLNYRRVGRLPGPRHNNSHCLPICTARGAFDGDAIIVIRGVHHVVRINRRDADRRRDCINVECGLVRGSIVARRISVLAKEDDLPLAGDIRVGRQCRGICCSAALKIGQRAIGHREIAKVKTNRFFGKGEGCRGRIARDVQRGVVQRDGDGRRLSVQIKGRVRLRGVIARDVRDIGRNSNAVRVQSGQITGRDVQRPRPVFVDKCRARSCHTSHGDRHLLAVLHIGGGAGNGQVRPGLGGVDDIVPFDRIDRNRRSNRVDRVIL